MDITVSFNSFERKAKNSVEANIPGCHTLKPYHKLLTPDSDPDYHTWVCKGTATLPNTYLHGPASLRSSRVVIYPCDRNQCQCHCPCIHCRGVVDTKELDTCLDHKVYHQVPHLLCEYCNKTIELNPIWPENKITYCGMVKSWKIGHSYIHSHGRPYHDFMRLNHKQRKSLDCEECDKTFTTKKHRKRHVISIHYRKKFKCTECEKLFGRLESLRKHEKSHSIKKKLRDFSNSNASVSDDDDNDLGYSMDTSNSDLERDDMEDTADSSVHKSEKDNQNDNETYIASNKANAKKASFICDVCSKNFSSKFNLRSHTEKLKYSCDVCPSQFCSKAAVNIHKSTEHDGESFSCAICGKGFDAQWLLKRHVKETKCSYLKTNHSEAFEENEGLSEARHVLDCKLCGVRFSSFSNLKKHSMKKKHHCENCSKKYCSVTEHASHNRTKHGIINLQCQDCGKQFNLKKNLNRHIKLKVASPCIQCGLMLCNLYDLKCHKRECS